MNQSPKYHPLELIRRWLQGDARREEEQQLEKLAAEDPFLADALDGYRRLPEGQHDAHLERLRERIRARSRRRGGLLFYLPRAAAAVVGVAMLAGGFWYFNSGASPELAMQEPGLVQENTSEQTEEAGAEISLADEAMEPAAPNVPAEKKAAAPANSGSPRPPVKPETEVEPFQPERQQMADVPAIAQAAPSPQTESDESTLDDGLAVKELEEERSISLAGKEQAAGEFSARPRSTAPTPTASGQVKDENGDPLIGVVIQELNTGNGTITDIDGNFSLTLDSSSSQIELSHIGFQSQILPIRAGDTIQAVLPESANLLEEAVVTGMEIQNRQKQKRAEPQPVGGFKALKRYLRKNLKYPEAARMQGIEGQVVLSFYVQEDGTLADIKVEESLGYGCNEEAIRLLREGPRWRGAGSRATLSVPFKL